MGLKNATSRAQGTTPMAVLSVLVLVAAVVFGTVQAALAYYCYCEPCYMEEFETVYRTCSRDDGTYCPNSNYCYCLQTTCLGDQTCSDNPVCVGLPSNPCSILECANP